MRFLLLLFLAACPGCMVVGPDPSDAPAVPQPTSVAAADIPRPFAPRTYFRHEDLVGKAPEDVLAALLADGLRPTDAWYPDGSRSGPCLMLQIPRLLVRLDAPDDRIRAHHFTPDSSFAGVDACTPYWLHFDF